jgi:hypothetical protein
MEEQKKVDGSEELNQQKPEDTEEKPTDASADAQDVDYKTKFSESTREAMRLLEDNKKMAEELESFKRKLEEDVGANYSNSSESLYPGFDTLSDEEQKNLIAYTEGIKKKALEDLYKDPSIAFARESYNERKWDSAFDQVSTEFPELREVKDEFKKKYFNIKNVPENIADIMKDLSKVYLFDRARDIGAKDAIEKSNRIDIERQQAGDKTPVAKRSLEDWYKLAQSNPAEFAKHSKEFNADFEKLK